ncbi:MAG TPA: sigma-70 family RNA polymerase sigma factor [Candidatus Kapabacteria bacterium]|nr:sigma-70 family RNA polymerase sigma factor [Candidatus Kapabacteria bacterium]
MYHSQSQKNQIEDARLMRLVVRKDSEAFSTLFHKYDRMVFSVILKIIKNEEDARELMQDVFLQVWKKADYYIAEKGPLSNWLVTIAHNKAINYLRLTRIKLQTLEDNYDYDEFAQLLTHETIQERTALDLAIEEEAAKQVTIVLEKLPPTQRLAIFEAYYNGRSQNEIAKQFNIPIGTVKTRVFQGLKKMHKLMNHNISLQY